MKNIKFEKLTAITGGAEEEQNGSSFTQRISDMLGYAFSYIQISEEEAAYRNNFARTIGHMYVLNQHVIRYGTRNKLSYEKTLALILAPEAYSLFNKARTVK